MERIEHNHLLKENTLYLSPPASKEEFDLMFKEILTGYENMRVSDELVHRMKLDLNCLLAESIIDILHEESPMKLSGYEVYRDTDTPNIFHIDPLWIPMY